MFSEPVRPDSTMTAVVARMRDLNDRVLRVALGGGEQSLQAYEHTLRRLADAQETAGDRGADWLRRSARAQASLTRRLAEALPAMVERWSAQGRELGEEVTDRAHQVPGLATAEGAVRGVAAREQDLPIPHYDELTAAEVNEQLPGLSDVQLSKVAVYEARTKDRKTVHDRINALRG